MASGRSLLDYVLEQLSGLEDVTYRPMMGEYIIYFHGKVIGGIYDDRFLVKLTKSAVAIMPNADIPIFFDGCRERCRY
jgi:TfoX/Sxy family transcriptional regulator of competence genes